MAAVAQRLGMGPRHGRAVHRQQPRLALRRSPQQRCNRTSQAPLCGLADLLLIPAPWPKRCDRPAHACVPAPELLRLAKRHHRLDALGPRQRADQVHAGVSPPGQHQVQCLAELRPLAFVRHKAGSIAVPPCCQAPRALEVRSGGRVVRSPAGR